MIAEAAPVRWDVSLRPRLIEIGGDHAPGAPQSLEDTGLSVDTLSDLALKIVHTTPHFTTDWLIEQSHLPRSIANELLEKLRKERMVEILGQDGLLGYRWAITEGGRSRAAHLLSICGYIGPAPVSLDAYGAMIEWQCNHLPDVSQSQIRRATESLVLPEQIVKVAGLAALSRRSLFLYGPPGNGKTTIGHLLHMALQGEIWIPHSIAVGDQVVRLLDPQVHQPVPPQVTSEQQRRIDGRWVRIRRPFIVAAGELRLEDLDLSFSNALGFYEAPLHIKANGGLFLLDDFGYQRVNPFQLLNRWVFPLEHEVDFMTLRTGQKLLVPFRQMLVLSTNLDPDSVMEPAILRRIGYRIHMDNPSNERYHEIFNRYAQRHEVRVPYDVVERLIQRHEEEGRPLRCCGPRDLVERARDVCRFQGRPLELSDDVMDLAWAGYYGSEAPSGHGADEEDEHEAWS